MSVSGDQQFLFGGHVASRGTRQQAEQRLDLTVPDRPRVVRVASAWTAGELTEVAPGSPLVALCSALAEALPPGSRVTVVLTDSVGPSGPAERPAAQVVALSPETRALVRIEWLLREGPVGAALHSQEAVISGRLHADARWSRFGRAVLAHGTSSAVAVPLPLGDRPGGVVAAFAREEDAFDDRDLRVLGAFGRVIGGVVSGDEPTTPADGVEELAGTHLVDQAIGILISQNCDEEHAMDRLMRISLASATPLAAAARMIVDEAREEAHLRYISRSSLRRFR